MSESSNARKGIKTIRIAMIRKRGHCQNHQTPVRALRRPFVFTEVREYVSSESSNARKGIKTYQGYSLRNLSIRQNHQTPVRALRRSGSAPTFTNIRCQNHQTPVRAFSCQTLKVFLYNFVFNGLCRPLGSFVYMEGSHPNHANFPGLNHDLLD